MVTWQHFEEKLASPVAGDGDVHRVRSAGLTGIEVELQAGVHWHRRVDGEVLHSGRRILLTSKQQQRLLPPAAHDDEQPLGFHPVGDEAGLGEGGGLLTRPEQPRHQRQLVRRRHPQTFTRPRLTCRIARVTSETRDFVRIQTKNNFSLRINAPDLLIYIPRTFKLVIFNIQTVNNLSGSRASVKISRTMKV